MKEKINKYLYNYYLENYSGLVYILFSKILSEPEFENLFQYVMINNSDFSKYLILYTFEPDQLKKNFRNKELKFFETGKIKKFVLQNMRFLVPLKDKLLINNFFNLKSIINCSEQQLYAFYLNDSKGFSKIRNEVSNKFTLADNLEIEEYRLKSQLLKEITKIKNFYTQKKIDSINKRDLNRMLQQEEKKRKKETENIDAQIYYLFPTKQFSYMEKIGKKVEHSQIIKFPKIHNLNKNIYYDLKLQKTLNGNFEILNERYLFNKETSTIIIYDIVENRVINKNFDKFEKNKNMLFLGNNDKNIIVVSDTINGINYNKFKYQIGHIIFGLFIIILSLYGLFNVKDIWWLYIIWLIGGIGGTISAINNSRVSNNISYFSWWLDTIKEYSLQDKSIMPIKKCANINNNLQNIHVNNIVFSNSFKVIEKNDHNIQIYNFKEYKFKKKYTINDLVSKKVIEDIEDGKENLKNNLENQIRNLSDANEIIKIKTNYKKSILSLISLNDALSVFYFLKPTEINNINLYNVLKQIFKFKNEKVNNFILSKLNELLYQINDNCIILLKNYCDEELLLINITISFDAMSLNRILSYKPDKKLEQKYYLYFELVFNKYYLNQKEKINLEMLYEIKEKLKPICSKTNYLANHLDFLIQIVGKYLKIIEIPGENNPESKDIEINK